ncbi:DUF637 domain-containing protein [Photorhabdus khanii]|nr:DUF637 domain-containing protein [Photorhabdus khanii]
MNGGSFTDNLQTALLNHIGNQMNAEEAKLIGHNGEILGVPGKSLLSIIHWHTFCPRQRKKDGVQSKLTRRKREHFVSSHRRRVNKPGKLSALVLTSCPLSGILKVLSRLKAH